jgi:hypothetical protein
VDQQFAELGVLKVEPLDPFEKPVNAGRTAVFRFEITNEDKEAHHVDLEIQGIHAEWASVGGPRVLFLEPGQKSNFSLAVHAPDDAIAEERAELFVVAQSQEETGVVAMSRLRATVVTMDVPDESNMIASAGGEDSPALAAWLVVMALVVPLIRRRGRR